MFVECGSQSGRFYISETTFATISYKICTLLAVEATKLAKWSSLQLKAPSLRMWKAEAQH